MKAFTITTALLAPVVTPVFPAFEEATTEGVSALKLTADESHTRAATVSKRQC
jgi:hypothetical protein